MAGSQNNSQDEWEDLNAPQSDEWEDLNKPTATAAPAAKPDMLDQFATDYALPALRGVGGALLSGVGAISSTLDKYGGAPVRSAISSAVEGKPEEALGAAYSQFGEDPTKAPSGKDIMSRAGVSTQEYTTPFILNPYTGPEGRLKVSPAGVAGAALETFSDPMTYAGFAAGPAARLGLRGAQAAGDTLGWVGKQVAPKVGKLVSRIPEETTRAFIENPKRITANAKMYTPEDLKDILDETVGAVKADVETTKAQSDLLRQQLKEKLKQKRFDLQKETVPADVVNEIQGSLENQKAVLGKLSERADAALERSGITFEKQHLLELIDGIGKSAGKYAIGEQRVAALNKLYATRERIAGSMPDIIPAADLRDALQQVRRDIDYNLSAGEFNDDLNKMRKEFTARMSDALKDRIPEYKAYMGKMSQLADSLDQMNKLFGSEKYPAKAYGTLQNVRQGKRQDIVDVIRRNAELTKNQMLGQTLAKYQRDAALLNRMQRGEDLSKELFPQDLSNLRDMEATQKMAEDIYAPVARLRPGTDKTQNVVRRFGYPTASIEDARAVEEAGKLAGMDIPQILRDTTTYRAFDKDATAGSRNVKQLGVLGYIADRFGGPTLRAGIRGGVSLKGGINRVLNYLATDPNFAAKYGRFFKGASVGGMGLSSATHHLLLNNDPEYRKYFEEGTP